MIFTPFFEANSLFSFDILSRFLLISVLDFCTDFSDFESSWVGLLVIKKVVFLDKFSDSSYIFKQRINLHVLIASAFQQFL